MTAGPLVTIGIPAYDRPEGLERALRSAVGQSFRNLEIIISDDASPSDLSRIAGRFAEHDPRVRYVRQASNLGPAANHEWLREEAAGKYFIWLSDDDSFEDTFVEKAVRLMERDPSVVLCFCDYLYVEEDGAIVGARRLTHLHPEAPWSEGQLDFFSYPYSMAANLVSGMYRLDVLRRVRSPFTNTFRRIMSGHEAPLLAQVARKGRVAVIPELLFTRTQHSKSNRSLAHSVSKGLRRWEIALLYVTIQSRLALSAIRAKGSLRQRLRLLRAVLRASARKVRDLGRSRKAASQSPATLES